MSPMSMSLSMSPQSQPQFQPLLRQQPFPAAAAIAASMRAGLPWGFFLGGQGQGQGIPGHGGLLGSPPMGLGMGIGMGVGVGQGGGLLGSPPQFQHETAALAYERSLTHPLLLPQHHFLLSSLMGTGAGQQGQGSRPLGGKRPFSAAFPGSDPELPKRLWQQPNFHPYYGHGRGPADP
jgi:hypothetical protein